MDAASFLVSYAFLTNVKPIPFAVLGLVALSVAVRIGWSLAHDVMTSRRITERYRRI